MDMDMIASLPPSLNYTAAATEQIKQVGLNAARNWCIITPPQQRYNNMN